MCHFPNTQNKDIKIHTWNYDNIKQRYLSLVWQLLLGTNLKSSQKQELEINLILIHNVEKYTQTNQLSHNQLVAYKEEIYDTHLSLQGLQFFQTQQESWVEIPVFCYRAHVN